MQRFALRALVWSSAYFFIALIIAVLARGWDLDQLTSRSAISGAAAAVEPRLWIVQTMILGTVPRGRISEHLWVIPVALVANVLAYGVLLSALHSIALSRLRNR